jgi:transposase-like protein
MPPMTPADWHVPLRCPHCEAEGGHPFCVQSKSAREVIVRVRCSACAHEWVLERETPTLASIVVASLTVDEDSLD